jgi:hypothetical protein
MAQATHYAKPQETKLTTKNPRSIKTGQSGLSLENNNFDIDHKANFGSAHNKSVPSKLARLNLD